MWEEEGPNNIFPYYSYPWKNSMIRQTQKQTSQADPLAQNDILLPCRRILNYAKTAESETFLCLNKLRRVMQCSRYTLKRLHFIEPSCICMFWYGLWICISVPSCYKLCIEILLLLLLKLFTNMTFIENMGRHKQTNNRVNDYL